MLSSHTDIDLALTVVGIYMSSTLTREMFSWPSQQ